jgi:hypothetical protein
MLSAREDYGRQQNIRFSVRLRLQKCDDGEFAQIEFLLTHKWFEAFIRGIYIRKNKIYKR